jgi:hypothetical protein
MSSERVSAAEAVSIRESVRSVWLVIFMAVGTSSLRIAIGAANWITLWYLYGRATVAHDHLRITKIKPQLVVSNGDVLRGIGFYHYLVGVATWLPLAIGLMMLIYYALLPKRHREVLQGKEKTQSVSAFALLWTLALFFLVAGLLPMWAALAVAAASVVAALIWASRIQYGSGTLG